MNSNKYSDNRLNMEPPFGGLTVSSLSIKLLWLTSSSHAKPDAGILKGLLSIKELGGVSMEKLLVDFLQQNSISNL